MQYIYYLQTSDSDSFINEFKLSESKLNDEMYTDVKHVMQKSVNMKFTTKTIESMKSCIQIYILTLFRGSASADVFFKINTIGKYTFWQT